MSGVSILSYWLSNFLIDYAKYLVPAIFGSLMVYAFNIEVFSSDSESLGAVVALFFLYGWAVIPFSYLLGFLFKDYGNA